MDPSYAGRDLNVDFPAVRKETEILQLMMLKPDLAILDETDSGWTWMRCGLRPEGIHEYQKENPDGALLIITHSTHPGRASCGRNPYHGERAYCGIRGCIAGG